MQLIVAPFTMREQIDNFYIQNEKGEFLMQKWNICQIDFIVAYFWHPRRLIKYQQT